MPVFSDADRSLRVATVGPAARSDGFDGCSRGAARPRAGWIDRGRIVAAGTAREFSVSSSTKAAAVEPDRLAEVCTRRGWTFHLSGRELYIDAAPEDISRACLEHMVVLTHLSNVTESALEERFLALTSGEFSSRNNTLEQIR